MRQVDGLGMRHVRTKNKNKNNILRPYPRFQDVRFSRMGAHWLIDSEFAPRGELQLARIVRFRSDGVSISHIQMNDGNPSFQAALTEIFFEREQVVEHATSSKVTKYFTGPNVKRLLRYYAQDYIRIGMPLPGWLGKIPFPEA